MDEEEEARFVSVTFSDDLSSAKLSVGQGHATTPNGGSFLIADNDGENSPSSSSSVIPNGDNDSPGVSNGGVSPLVAAGI